jgi:glycosyltransferase involved in cell wall biosynthesis
MAVRPRVLWLTNLASPYRLPVWEAVGEHVDLTVVVLAESERWREPWARPGTRNFTLESIDGRQWRLPKSEVSLYFGRHTSALVRRFRPDVVVVTSWEQPVNLALGVLAWRRKARFVVHYGTTPHSHRFQRGPAAFYRRRFLASAHAIVSYGTATDNELAKMGIPSSRVVSGFNTVDVKAFHEGAQRLRQRAPLDNGGHRYLFVGRFVPRKNADLVIRAFHEVAAVGDTLTLVGSGPDEDALVRLAEQLELTASVTFRGHLEGDDLIAEYASAHTLVVPSTEEVWGLVANEGLACGLHCVLSDRTGAAADLSTMRGVFVADPAPGRLASAMIESKFAWTGPIQNPAVLCYTPQRLAKIFLVAMDVDL